MRFISTRLKAQIIKELLSVLRDRRSRFVLIGPPIIELLVFSFAATLNVQNVNIAVFNHDTGKWSQELVSRIGASGIVQHIYPVYNSTEVGQMIQQREVIAAINIPQTFSRDINAGRPAHAQIILDGRRANAGQVMLGYLNTITNRLGAELASEPYDESASTTVRHWFNPNLIYRWFVVPSIGGILITFVTLLLTALSIARERELGTFDQLLVSPCTPTEIIISKMAPALIIGIILGSLMVAAGVFAFGIPFTGSFILLVISMAVFILSVVGIGLMISSVCSTQQQAILGTFAVGVPAVLMSGFATPVDNMPKLLQWIAQAIPLTHYLVILQGSFLKALPAKQIFMNAWPMAVTALFTLTIATVFVRGKLQN